MIKGLRTTIYKVSDLARAKAWYTTAFGVTPYFDEPFYVGFNIGGFELGLDPDVPASAPSTGVEPDWSAVDSDAAQGHFFAHEAKEREARGKSGREPVASTKGQPGGVHTYWGVDDLEATYAHLLALGAREHEAPKEVGGGIKVATVLDPFGNIIGLILNPHFDLQAVR